MTAAPPEGVDWFLWRVLSSDRINASLSEVADRWSLDDVLDANLVLDMWDQLAIDSARKK